MKKEEKLKVLLQKYLNGSLTSSERENFFYLINNEGIDETINSELYLLWDNQTDGKPEIASQESFGKIKQILQIPENKYRQDDLILKGIEYIKLKSSRRFLSIFIRYAAVFIFAVLLSFFVNYWKGDLKTKEVALQEIVAPLGSKIKIILSDSSEVWLNSGSKIVYADHFLESDREVYLEGEAFFNIRKNNYKPFYINTSDLSIKVLGTSLNVKSYFDEDFIETTLVTGQIEIKEIGSKGKNMKSAFLMPEQKAFYNKETGRMKIEQRNAVNIEEVKSDIRNNNIKETGQISLSTSQEIAWKDNKFIFSNEEFSYLSRRLERWYNVEIEVMNEELNEYKFTGAFENETIEQAMQAFKIAFPLDYKFEKNKITIWKSVR